MLRRASAAVVLAAALASTSAVAQTVSLAGSLGTRALLMIDGKAKQVAVGSTVDGVRLVSLGGNEAVVEVQGKRLALVLGGAQVNLGGAEPAGNGSRIVIPADLGGHFYVAGSINGKAVRFVVDTGATHIALSEFDAERIGLDYKKGERSMAMTANGPVPVYRVSLAQVRVGDVQVYNVQASVLPGAMPIVLLGNSFLSRFQMQRDNDRLTLERRY